MSIRRGLIDDMCIDKNRKGEIYKIKFSDKDEYKELERQYFRPLFHYEYKIDE